MAISLLNDFPGKLLYCVCKIIMTDINGKDHHSTGFWYSTVIENKQVFGLITAKHCFENYSKAVLKLCRMDSLTGLPIDQLACDIYLSTNTKAQVPVPKLQCARCAARFYQDLRPCALLRPNFYLKQLTLQVFRTEDSAKVCASLSPFQ